MSAKKFYRSRKERVLGGVLGGLAEYLGVDPNLLRLAYIVLLVLGDLTGALIGVYILAWIFIPEAPHGDIESEKAEPRINSKEFSRVVLLLIAAILVIYGISILFGELGQLFMSGLFSLIEIFWRAFFGPWYVVVEGVRINVPKLVFSLIVILVGTMLIFYLRREK